MPLPWKKAKVAKISKLVADLHAPKHGGSLVVETGFPTSLVDLFVKNRDRLKKSSKRKHIKPLEVRTSNSSCTAASPPTLPPLPPEPVRASVSVEDPDRQVKISQGEEEEVGGAVGSFVEHKACEERSVVLTAVKTFLVVVLAMSTKKLVLAITMSAFLLLFLECVMARVLKFLGPSVDAERVLSCLIQRLSVKKSLLVWFGMGRCEDSTNQSTNQLVVQQDESCGLNEGIEMESSVEGIQAEEIVEESRMRELERVSVGGEKRRECMNMARFMEEEEEDKKNPVLICKSERSRRAKFTSKIVHKFVPKKLRHVRKKGKEKKETEQEASYGEPAWFNRLSTIEEEEEHVISGGQEKDEILHALVEEIEQERCKGEDLNVSGKVLGVEEKKKSVVLGTNSPVYLILLLIVLVGLLGGKVLALVLTVGWSWMLWIFGKMRKSGDAYCSLPISR